MTGQPTVPSIPAAHRWLTEHGYDVTERTVRNHVDQGLLPAERSRGGKVKAIREIDLERYAKNNLTRNQPEQGDDRTRLIRAQADEREFNLALKRGQYLDREEEEQRDAAVLAGLRRHLESAAPDRLQGILATISTLVDEDTRAAIVARTPEWLQQDLDVLADIFDQFEGA
jgi:hypothetical protein